MTTRVKKTIRLKADINEQLASAAQEAGQSENRLIEEALAAYLSDRQSEYEKVADLFLQKYDEKYSAYMTRVRLGVRTADVNSQVLIEIMNTLLMSQQLTGDHYVSTREMTHPIVKKSKATIDEIIRHAKQLKDNRSR